MDAKRSNGKYIAAFAPYGYVKSPEDKHKLVVDEVASEIVKRIFREFLDGKSMYKILEGLNRDGIDSRECILPSRKTMKSNLQNIVRKRLFGTMLRWAGSLQMSSIPERWYITDLRVKMLATSTPRLCQRKHGSAWRIVMLLLSVERILKEWLP